MYLMEGRYNTGKELVDHMRQVWDFYWKKVNKGLEEVKKGMPDPHRPREVVAGGTRLTPFKQLFQVRADEGWNPSANEGSMRIEFNDKSNRVKFITFKPNMEMEFSPRLADILAIPNVRRVTLKDVLFGGGKTVNVHESDGEVDLNRGRRALFVYCSLVHDSVVGDALAPLLRSVPVRGKYGEVVREVFHQPMYMPLRTTNFDQVEISINSEDGQLMPFNSGVCSITLHFRRVESGIRL